MILEVKKFEAWMLDNGVSENDKKFVLGLLLRYAESNSTEAKIVEKDIDKVIPEAV